MQTRELSMGEQPAIAWAIASIGHNPYKIKKKKDKDKRLSTGQANQTLI